MIDTLIKSPIERFIPPFFGGDIPVIVDGFMIFTDGTMMQFTDDTVLYFGE